MSQTAFRFMHKSYALHEYYILDGMISQAYNKQGMKENGFVSEPRSLYLDKKEMERLS